MGFAIYDASAPVFARAMTNMAAWLDKAVAEGKDEAALMEARLAPDMRPLPAQIQMASDTAKSSVARLTGIAAPSMADTETTIAELKARCLKTIGFIDSVAPSAFDGADEREIVLTFQPGMGYRLTGASYLTGFALPNFFFHVTTAYAILRAHGVGLGKADFLQHMGMPERLHAEA
jgi:hypothetical protein